MQADVTVPGSYTIYTDTVNGISFKGTGTFTATGLNTVRLSGKGTPLAAGIHNFVVSYGTSGCSIAVTTSATLGSFTFDGAPGGCTGATPAGTYTVGTDLTSANTVNIGINVTGLGAYTVTTLESNGMTFSSSGVFTIMGGQTLVLSGTGRPVIDGPTNIPISAGGSGCSFSIPVVAAAGPAVFEVNCATGRPLTESILSALILCPPPIRSAFPLLLPHRALILLRRRLTEWYFQRMAHFLPRRHKRWC